jgi:integrase
LKWENIRDGCIEIQYGKTDNARRRLPLSPRVAAVVEMRKTNVASEWVFPAATRSGHIEPASIKRQHLKACKGPKSPQSAPDAQEKETWAVQPFPLYTLRHTCLTRWAPHMDPWTLAYLAGHRDLSITERYVHPQQGTLLDAMEKARIANGGHTSRHTAQSAANTHGQETAAIN